MKNIILAAVALLSINIFTPVFAGSAYAACAANSTAKGQVIEGIDATGAECDGAGVDRFVRALINVLSLIVGIAAVIVIILSGFKYITSAGDSAKITSAKNTLIYALIGLAIAVLAQFLVNFVFNTATNACPDNYHRQAKTNVCVKD